MIARTHFPCSICGDLLIDQHGALVCALCDGTEAEPLVFVDGQGVYTDGTVDDRRPITHCVRGCGSRLTVADAGTVCRQCRLER